MKPLLLPIPKEIRYEKKIREWNRVLNVSLPEELEFLALPTGQICPEAFTFEKTQKADVVFVSKPGLLQEEYELKVTGESVEISYASAKGALYGLVTLWQMVVQKRSYCCQIADAPDLPNRGFVLDISRGKVPKLETLKELANLLVRFKYNQMQLYIEGFSFSYPGYEQYTEEQSALTADEIKELETYCRERFLELVPNQNSLGHMAAWLAKREFRHLAETEEGFEVKGMKLPPTTLDAADPESLSFVTKLMDGLLPAFTSEYFHVGLDEAFELGRGKNKDKDKNKLYAEYTEKLYEEVKKRNKKMMMWADGAAKSTEMIEQLPKDIIFMEWGYEKEHPFAKRAEKYARAGRRFYVCPGTNSQLSITGITDNMLANIEAAAEAAVKYGAEGILLTDWGDLHHLQYLPISYPAIIHCAALAWNNREKEKEEELAQALERFVFMDSSRKMGQLLLEAGRYYQQEEFELPCRTLAVLPLETGLSGKEEYEQYVSLLLYLGERLNEPEVISPYIEGRKNKKEADFEKIWMHIDCLLQSLADVKAECEEGRRAVRELENALRMVAMLTKYRAHILEIPAEKVLDSEIDRILSEHKKVWLARNKVSGLNKGIECIEKLCAGKK